jgi:hypothetical protein
MPASLPEESKTSQGVLGTKPFGIVRTGRKKHAKKYKKVSFPLAHLLIRIIERWASLFKTVYFVLASDH